MMPIAPTPAALDTATMVSLAGNSPPFGEWAGAVSGDAADGMTPPITIAPIRS